MTHELRDAEAAVAKAKAHVHCGGCGAEVPRADTKAQRHPDSPEMQARLKHIEECPTRGWAPSDTD